VQLSVWTVTGVEYALAFTNCRWIADVTFVFIRRYDWLMLTMNHRRLFSRTGDESSTCYSCSYSCSCSTMIGRPLSCSLLSRSCYKSLLNPQRHIHVRSTVLRAVSEFLTSFGVRSQWHGLWSLIFDALSWVFVDSSNPTVELPKFSHGTELEGTPKSLLLFSDSVVEGLAVYSDCFPLDVDECKIDLAQCGGNAYCTNTIGSFLCICNPGFAGSDNECTGEYIQRLTSHSLLHCLRCSGFYCCFWLLIDWR